MAEDATEIEQLSREALVERARTLQTVLRVANEVAGGGTLQELCERFAAALVEYTRFAAVVVTRYRPQHDDFEILARRGAFNTALRTVPSIPAKGSMTGLGAVLGEMLTSDDLESDDRVEPSLKRSMLANGIASGATVPLIHGGEVVGAYNVLFPREHPLPRAERHMLGALGANLAAAMARVAATEREQRLAQRAQRAQQLESLGVLAAGIAHDFNNLLTAIVGNLEVASAFAEEHGGIEVAGGLADALAASERAAGLARQLMTFSRGGEPTRRPTRDLGQLLRQVATFATTGTSMRCEIRVESDLGTVAIDSGQIAQVIQNLVLNACQASPSGSTVTVTARRSLVDGGGQVVIEVSDAGCGIPPAMLPRIFEPFYSGRDGGVGLGLAICHSIATRHGGILEVRSDVGRGTTFTLTLPESDSPVDEAPPEAVPGQFAGRVLLMDDDPHVRATARRMLRSLGFQVDEAAEGAAALAAARFAADAGWHYRAALLDLTVVGGLGGADIATELRACSPQIKLILASGYVAATGAEWDAMLHKPYGRVELSQAFARALGRV